mgnify:CR=1 FL=1
MIFKLITRNPFALIASILCLAIVSCKDFKDCRSLYTNKLVVELIPQNQHHAQPIVFDSLVSGYHANNPSHVMSLFLNPAADSTIFYLYSSQPSIRIDTVTIFYKRFASLISPQCGAQQAYTLDSLQTTFAGDTIINRTLQNKGVKSKIDVQIFY